MSSFSAGSISSILKFDTSSFTGGVAQIASSAASIPGVIAQSIEAPLASLRPAMAQATAQVSSGVAEIGQKFEALEPKTHIKGDAKLDASGVSQGVSAAEGAMSGFPALVGAMLIEPLMEFAALAKEAFAAVVEGVRDVADHFQQVNLGSIKSGLDPATFSTFAAAAKASGVEVATFANGLELLQDRAANALRGDEGATKGFTDLGISAKELKGLLEQPKELLLRVADAMNAIDTPGKRVQAAMESMGRGGKEMLPFLTQGSAGILAMAADLGTLGAKVDTEEADMGAAWGLVQAQFNAAWEGIKTAVAAPILKYFQDNLDTIIPKLTAFASWIKDGVGAAMSQIIPAAETLWGVVESIGQTLGPVLIPILQVLGALLQGIWTILKPILDGLAVAFSGFGGLLNELTYGANSVQVAGSAASADAAYGRLQGDFGVAPQINVQANINLDADEASTQVAAKIGPDIARGYRELHAQAQAIARSEKVTHATGGRRH